MSSSPWQKFFSTGKFDLWVASAKWWEIMARHWSNGYTVGFFSSEFPRQQKGKLFWVAFLDAIFKIHISKHNSKFKRYHKAMIGGIPLTLIWNKLATKKAEICQQLGTWILYPLDYLLKREKTTTRTIKPKKTLKIRLWQLVSSIKTF